MSFKCSRVERELKVDLSGTLTFHQHYDADQLVYQVAELVDKGEVNKIRLNFSETQRLDSHWIGVLVRIMRKAKEKNVEFIVENPNHEVSRLFGLELAQDSLVLT